MARGLLTALLLLGTVSVSRAQDDSVGVVILDAGAAAPYAVAAKSLVEALPDGLRVRQLLLDRDDPAAMAERVRAIAPRVLVTLGTRATEWAMEWTEDVPIVFGMVLHPVQSGFVPSLEHPGERVTGASLDVPPALHFKAIREVLGVRRVGVLYNPAETGDVIDAARRAAQSQGIELVGAMVPEPAALDSALRQLGGRIEALWSVPDRTVFTRGAVERVLMYTLQNEIPFIGLSAQYVRAGALMALDTTYEENGHQVADRVVRVLEGERPETIKIGQPESVGLVFNPHIAKRLGIRIPDGARTISVGFAR